MAASRVVLCACLLVGAVAHAERRPVAVIDLSGDPAAPAVAEQIKRELTNHEALSRVLENEPLLIGKLLEDEDQRALDDARNEKEHAENALADFKFAEAADHAVRGMDWLNNAHPAGALGLYADLAFVLGQAKLGEKKPDEAGLAFAFVHRLQDKRRVDPSRYLPEVVVAFAKAQPAPATIALELRGSGRVWIDGVAVGEGDGTYKVGAGWHVVQLAGPDRQPRGIRIKAPVKEPIEIEDAPASTELKIQRARLALARAFDPADRANAMKHLAELTKVKDAVLLVSVNGKLSFANWRDGATGYDAPVFTAPSILHPENPSEPLDWLAPRKELPPPPQKQIVIPPEPERWYQKRWLQGTVIGGIIAIVGGSIVWAERGTGRTSVNTGTGFADGTASRPR